MRKMLNNEMLEKVTNVENLLKEELSTINNMKNSTNDNKDYLMNALEKLSNNFSSDNIIEESYMLPQLFKTLNEALSKVNSNLLIYKDLENSINSILFSISMQHSNEIINIEDIEKQLSLYNLKKMESKNSIINNSTYVEKFISSSKMIIEELDENVENSKENIIKQFKENRENTLKAQEKNTVSTFNIGNDTPTNGNVLINKESENNKSDNISKTNENNTDVLYKPYKISENDTLLISEKQQKIFLPYTLAELSTYTNSSEKSIEDVVEESFTLSITKFKNPTVSRFKESYNLAKNKSGYSILKSFNFAVEIMFKYSLNPAIIVACKNVEELKEYLTCLKEQKLDLFKPFKIRYEINPMKI